MGVRIQPYIEQYQVGEDLTWLTHWEDALESADSITLDSTSLAALFPATAPSPLVVVPSGTLLAQITGTGKWGPYDTGASDGRQLTTNLGFLGKTTQLNTATGAGGLADVGAPLIWQGSVSVSKLATATGKSSGAGVPDSAAKTALKLVRFVA